MKLSTSTLALLCTLSSLPSETPTSADAQTQVFSTSTLFTPSGGSYGFTRSSVPTTTTTTTTPFSNLNTATTAQFVPVSSASFPSSTSTVYYTTSVPSTMTMETQNSVLRGLSTASSQLSSSFSSSPPLATSTFSSPTTTAYPYSSSSSLSFSSTPPPSSPSSHYMPSVNAYTPATTSSGTLYDSWVSASQGDSADMFDPKVFRNWHLEINPYYLSILDSDPTAEEWVPCTVTADYGTPQAETFENAGCRYKGSVGSLRLCMSETTNTFDVNICRKLSIKVDTNKFVPDDQMRVTKKGEYKKDKQRIYGQKTLLFNGAPMDWSMMSERLMYTIMGHVGITAPRCVHSKVFLNGKFHGVFVMPEAVDDRFTKNRFKEDANKGEGALFKETWLNDPSLDFKKKQVDGDVEEHEWMRSLVNLIETASDSQASAIMSTYFDVDQLVSAIAFNTIIMMTDDWRQRHNFYWYLRQDDTGAKKLVYIPWDYDRINDEAAPRRGASGTAGPWYQTLRPTHFKCSQKPTTVWEKAQAQCAGMGEAFCAKMRTIYEQLPVDIDIPVQCDRITHMMSIALKDKVAARVLDMIRTFTPELVEAYVTGFSNQIEEALKRDPDGPVKSYWEPEKRELVNWVKKHRQQAINMARQGYTVQNFNRGGYEPGMFGGKFIPASEMGGAAALKNSISSSQKPLVTTGFRQGGGVAVQTSFGNRFG